MNHSERYPGLPAWLDSFELTRVEWHGVAGYFGVLPVARIDANTGQVAGLPANPRRWTADELASLKASLKETPELTLARGVLVYPNGDRLVALGGNMRQAAAKAMKEKDIPAFVFPQDTPADKLMEIVAKDNGSFGEWDFDMLANEWSDKPLTAWGVPAWEQRNAEDAEKEGSEERGEDEDDFDENENEIQTRSKLGDVWKLGGHRLMCGDSTDASNVATLLGGEVADMVFTDPPYGVGVSGGSGGKDRNNRIMGDLTQTTIPFSFDIAVNQATKPKAHIYFCGAESNLYMYQKLFDKHLAILPKHLIWVKNGFSMKQNGYHNQFEIIYFGYKRGGGATWYGGRKEDEASDVWQIKRDSTSEYKHPTQKPVAIPARAIRNSSQEGEIVLDLFGGSGSTLIAAEQLNRRCYIMELDPHYVDVILARWERFTGKKAELLNPGEIVPQGGE